MFSPNKKEEYTQEYLYIEDTLPVYPEIKDTASIEDDERHGVLVIDLFSHDEDT